MSETYDMLKAINYSYQYQVNCELTPEQCKWILDWYEKWHKAQSRVCKQERRITELEERIKELYADNEFLRESYPHFIETEDSDVN